MAASQSQVLSRELVQKSLHQLTEYNHETYGAFVKPIVAAHDFKKDWDKLTRGLQAEEMADLEQAVE